MPIRLPGNLPAADVLQRENVFVMSDQQAQHQDIRPLKILLLNLMPKKIETEIHLIRMLSNTPLQVDLELMRIHDKPSKNTSIEHMETFYKEFEGVKDRKFDGLIITGAPLGAIPFEEVIFWEELKTVMDWSRTHVTSTLFLCWAVQAAMYHHYGIMKRVLDKKVSGVFAHHLVKPHSPIVRGFDDVFDAPHSRYAEISMEAIASRPELEVVAASEEVGAFLVARKDGRQVFVIGHSEYEPNCLKDEYERDMKAGLNPSIPENYFPNDDPTQQPTVTWKSHGNLLFNNWLNYYVYQLTPFDMEKIGGEW
ncbi:homoserine O-acetyltransferase MetA [Gilvimarinus sp. F26214L]|uniref:homoserine O-acetyltransferase MetA n=1 Tax=Gilvimarinus sp. DZF01 TaxID=3461371 RepID=UPI0040457A01